MSVIHSVSVFLLISQFIACAEGGDTNRLQRIAIPPAMDDDPYTRNMGGEMTGNTMVRGVVAGEMTANTMGGESNAGEMIGNVMAGEMVGNVMAGDMNAGEMAFQDSDRDYIVDSEDNCPHVYNPEQSDINSDGQGDACEPDVDRDGIPDQWDPAPMDTTWPGRALPDTVYAHTSSELHALDVKRLSLSYVSSFSFDRQGDHLLTDIAFDRSGILWAISYDRLWVCHPQRGECREQGRLPNQFNGLTFIPGDLFNANQDILVGISLDGSWHKLEVFNGSIASLVMGRYPDESSSGDAFSMEGLGTFASVKRPNIADDIIISLNPLQINQISDIVTLTGYHSIFGLAGWRGKLFAFDETGVVLQINLRTQEIITIANDGQSWWGAGVSSVLHTRPAQ